MKFLRKLHSRREPPGLEWAILKRLPGIAAAGVAIPLLVAAGNRWFPAHGVIDAAKQATTVDILAFATGVTILTAVFTVAIGCVTVIVMKGPAYVADPYYHEAVQSRSEPDSDR